MASHCAFLGWKVFCQIKGTGESLFADSDEEYCGSDVGSGPKNVKILNCTYMKSDMPESIDIDCDKWLVV
jgi:hypothetical protein